MKRPLLKSGLICAALSVLNCLIITNTLIEVTFIEAFSLVLAGLLLLIASSFAYRIFAVKNVSVRKKAITMGLLGVLFISSIFCFFMDISWFKLSFAIKIPLYALLGCSLSFTLAYTDVEIFNTFLLPIHSVPFVSTRKQVYLVIISSVIMGMLFGFIFGTLDVEDKYFKVYDLYKISLPIGLIIGFIIGYFNELWRIDFKSIMIEEILEYEDEQEDFDL